VYCNTSCLGAYLVDVCTWALWGLHVCVSGCCVHQGLVTVEGFVTVA